MAAAEQQRHCAPAHTPIQKRRAQLHSKNQKSPRTVHSTEKWDPQKSTATGSRQQAEGGQSSGRYTPSGLQADTMKLKHTPTFPSLYLHLHCTTDINCRAASAQPERANCCTPHHVAAPIRPP